jgi:hypothetical protein
MIDGAVPARALQDPTLRRNPQECPKKARLIEPPEGVAAMIVRVDDVEYWPVGELDIELRRGSCTSTAKHREFCL